MSFVIRKPGILSTVQDLGRAGSRRFGVNPGGAMDRTAVRIINTLLGNDDSAATLEMHFPAAEIEFEHDIEFAIGGADFAAELDHRTLDNWSTVLAHAGSVLRFRGKPSGARAYLGIRGGIAADQWLGSRSTNLSVRLGGHQGRPLQKGDRIDCAPSGDTFVHLRAAGSIIPRYSRYPTVRLIPGPEFDLLTATSERELVNGAFTLTSDCDRMGFRLVGKPLHLLHRREMVSAGVTFGTIQLLPDGQLIVLMADHQTSGGYPRVGNVVSVDLPLLAQCGPGNGVGFAIVPVGEAESLSLQFEQELNFLKAGCRFQRNAHGGS